MTPQGTREEACGPASRRRRSGASVAGRARRRRRNVPFSPTTSREPRQAPLAHAMRERWRERSPTRDPGAGRGFLSSTGCQERRFSGRFDPSSTSNAPVMSAATHRMARAAPGDPGPQPAEPHSCPFSSNSQYPYAAAVVDADHPGLCRIKYQCITGNGRPAFLYQCQPPLPNQRDLFAAAVDAYKVYIATRFRTQHVKHPFNGIIGAMEIELRQSDVITGAFPRRIQVTESRGRGETEREQDLGRKPAQFIGIEFPYTVVGSISAGLAHRQSWAWALVIRDRPILRAGRQRGRQRR